MQRQEIRNGSQVEKVRVQVGPVSDGESARAVHTLAGLYTRQDVPGRRVQRVLRRRHCARRHRGGHSREQLGERERPAAEQPLDGASRTRRVQGPALRGQVGPWQKVQRVHCGEDSAPGARDCLSRCYQSDRGRTQAAQK